MSEAFGSTRRSGGVSFTTDTLDNEGTAKKYEKEGLHSPTRDVNDNNIKPQSHTTSQHDVIVPKVAEIFHEPEVFVKQPEVSPKTDSRPLMRDQSVATENEALTGSDLTPNDVTDHARIAHTSQRQDYALQVKSPRGILKHANGTATLQLNQPNQLLISAPDKFVTLPNGSLRVNTNLVSPSSPSRLVSPSPTLKMPSRSYTLRKTSDNVSIVSISGYEPFWDTRSNYSSDTIRTLDDQRSGTVRTMVSLGNYVNPYTTNELPLTHFHRDLNESSTDPLEHSPQLLDTSKVRC